MKTLPRRFKIKIHNQEHSKLVQNKLLELGYTWSGGESGFLSEAYSTYKEKTMISVGQYRENKLTYGEECGSSSSIEKQISTDDLFSFSPRKIETVVLNDKHSAVLSSDGTIVVGCQTFSIDIIDKLVDARKKLM